MGVSYLLDTHVVVWLVGGAPTPPARVMDHLEADDAQVLVSAVSAYELATKVRLGKLDSVADLVASWRPSIRRLGAVELTMTHEHAVRGGELAWEHRDPFDRLLVAQAQVDDLTLVTADNMLLRAPDVSLLPW